MHHFCLYGCDVTNDLFYVVIYGLHVRNVVFYFGLVLTFHGKPQIDLQKKSSGAGKQAGSPREPQKFTLSVLVSIYIMFCPESGFTSNVLS